MSELPSYYERLLQVIQSDVEELLQEPDISKRSPKKILDYLTMASKCEEQISAYNDTTTDDWNSLSPEAQRKILEIIENDRS